MKAVFLGHQSWLISEGKTNILIDPVLYEGFGSQDDNSIEIYPPRTISIKDMPKIDAIILSHEHSDHFHIPTLLQFKNTPIIVSSIMVDCVNKIILKYGLRNLVIPFYELYKIEDLEIILYPAGIDTVFWESRVSQIFIRSTSNIENSLFIAVDALVSERFKNDIAEEMIAIPNTVIVSNNSQLTPKNVLGSLDNFKDEKTNNRKEIPGLSLLKELLVDYLEELEQTSNIIICGGGFTKKYDTHFGSFPLSDQNKLAEIANYFSIDKKIFGPLPGQTILIDGNNIKYGQNVEWISLDQIRLNEIKQKGIDFKKSPTKIDIKPILAQKLSLNLTYFSKEMNLLARNFMLSEIGCIAIDFISFKNHKILPYGFAIKLVDYENYEQFEYYVLNFNSAKFELIDVKSICEENIPFGVELFYNDFIGILSGEIQIWDLGGIAIKSWYQGEKSNSPVGFFYSYFGEQIQPDLNIASLFKRWENLYKL